MVHETTERCSYVTFDDRNLDMRHAQVQASLYSLFRKDSGTFNITFADLQVFWQWFVVKLVKLVGHKPITVCAFGAVVVLSIRYAPFLF